MKNGGKNLFACLILITTENEGGGSGKALFFIAIENEGVGHCSHLHERALLTRLVNLASHHPLGFVLFCFETLTVPRLVWKLRSSCLPF